jgi:hypothetical protein
VPVETLYVQLLFRRRVPGADARGWVSVGVAHDRLLACRRASSAYSRLLHPVAGTPHGVRVVSDQQIRRESGERGLRRAGAGILAMALALESASDSR